MRLRLRARDRQAQARLPVCRVCSICLFEAACAAYSRFTSVTPISRVYPLFFPAGPACVALCAVLCVLGCGVVAASAHRPVLGNAKGERGGCFCLSPVSREPCCGAALLDPVLVVCRAPPLSWSALATIRTRWAGTGQGALVVADACCSPRTIALSTPGCKLCGSVVNGLFPQAAQVPCIPACTQHTRACMRGMQPSPA